MFLKISNYLLNARKWLSGSIESIINPDIEVHSDGLLGEGFSGSVFKCKYKDDVRALKIFYETGRKEREEAIYKLLESNRASFVPRMHFSEKNYIVMDFLDGNLFYELLESDKFTSDNDTIIITNILDSYFELHRLGIVHVDVRSRNLLVDSNFNIKIIDFGDSWMDKDFIIDLTRLARKFFDIIYESRLEEILDYAQKACRNKLAFMLFREFYEDEDFKWLRDKTGRVNVPTNEYYAILGVRKVFRGLDRKIKDFNERYLIALQNQTV